MRHWRYPSSRPLSRRWFPKLLADHLDNRWSRFLKTGKPLSSCGISNEWTQLAAVAEVQSEDGDDECTAISQGKTGICSIHTSNCVKCYLCRGTSDVDPKEDSTTTYVQPPPPGCNAPRQKRHKCIPLRILPSPTDSFVLASAEGALNPMLIYLGTACNTATEELTPEAIRFATRGEARGVGV